MKGRALFIINSPFQALCALEAINHYGINHPSFAHTFRPIIQDKTIPVVKGYGDFVFVFPPRKGTFSLIKATKKALSSRFDYIFIGDWFSYGQYIMALSVAGRNTTITYLDDGNSTIEIMPPVSRKRYRSRNQKICYFLGGAYERIIGIKKRFFTIFDYKQLCGISAEKNSFSSLVNNTNNPKQGVYIIGTNSSALQFRDLTYQELLLRLSKLLVSDYPSDTVYYCPHRGDCNDYSSLFSSFGWELFNTEVSVEYDFINNNINPRYVIGFGSTALFTLKKLYPDTTISSVSLNLVSEKANDGYRVIENYYKQFGIGILSL